MKRIAILFSLLLVCAALPCAAETAQTYETRVFAQGESVQIQYPFFPESDALNALIADKIAGLADDELDYMSLQYAVTLENDRVISMVFWGDANVKQSMHPSTVLYPLTVKRDDLAEVKLEELYALDEAFESAFFAKAFFPTEPVTSYDAESFAEMLQLQTPEYNVISPFAYPEDVGFFLKPEGIVLSLPSIHATGSDHFEAELRYEDVAESCRLEEPLW